MTKGEFSGQFLRLCKGFKYNATEEQTEAWYRRIGHVGLEPWAESVTNLLCASHFPRDLDAVLKVVDVQAQACRAKAILRDKPKAERVHARLGTEESGIDPVLFHVIKCYAGREQVQRYINLVTKNEDLDATTKRLELVRLRTEEGRLNEDIRAGIPSLSMDDALRLMERYEPAQATG